MRSSDEISKEIEAERARRPQGWAQRCERCHFWEAERIDEKRHSEDQEGKCHRYAPRIPHHHSAEAVGLIAWAVEELANVEHDGHFDYGYESEESPFLDWPRTCAHDWCGDFLNRSKD